MQNRRNKDIKVLTGEDFFCIFAVRKGECDIALAEKKERSQYEKS